MAIGGRCGLNLAIAQGILWPLSYKRDIENGTGLGGWRLTLSINGADVLDQGLEFVGSPLLHWIFAQEICALGRSTSGRHISGPHQTYHYHLLEMSSISSLYRALWYMASSTLFSVMKQRMRTTCVCPIRCARSWACKSA